MARRNSSDDDNRKGSSRGKKVNSPKSARNFSSGKRSESGSSENRKKSDRYSENKRRSSNEPRKQSGPRTGPSDNRKTGSFSRPERNESKPPGRGRSYNKGEGNFKKDKGERFPLDRKKSFNDKKSFSDRKSSSEKRSFSDKKSFPDKNSFSGKRSFPDKKSFSDKKAFPDKKSFSDKRSSTDKRSFSGKKPFNEKKTFDERKGSGSAKFAVDKDERRPRKSGRYSKEGNSGTDYTPQAPVQTGQMRLNRFIANSGVCSRREADELIGMGLISVNGKTVTEMGYKVNPGDVVRYEDKVLKAEKLVYLLLNKPKGFLTTTSDPQERNTVMHLVANAVKERVYPVGRLDRNTTGLLLLTNDGELADKLMHPSYNVKKIYKVELDRPLTKADFQSLQEGIQLEEGKAIIDDIAIVSEDGKTVGIELHIGWNRVVRRLFETLNYEVLKLDRSVYAGLDKKDLPRGHWRFLKKEEIVRLKHYK
jgi:23S rRNA pseudouridine2605 synthase